MGYHDIQQVCLNGHQITDRYNGSPESRKSYCPQCGKETIHRCQNCNEPIKGDYVSDVIVLPGSPAAIPTHCEACGKSFPWNTEKKLINIPKIFEKLKDTTSFEAFGIKFNGPAYMALLFLIVLIVFIVFHNNNKEDEHESWQNKPLSEPLSIYSSDSSYSVDSSFG